MIRETKLHIQKMTIYGTALLLLYVLQTTPGFLTFWGAKPLLVLPLVVSLAMMEGELVGGLFGLAAGILCDTSAITIFGINSLIYMAACVAIGLIVIYYMQPSCTNSLIFTGLVLLFRQLFEFFFYYVMWDYEDISIILLRHMLPMVLLTLLTTPLMYHFVRLIHGHYRRKLSD